MPIAAPAPSNENTVEILIQASDLASSTFQTIGVGLDAIGASAAIAQAQLLAVGGAVIKLSSATISKVAQITQIVGFAKDSLNTPIGKTLFDSIQSASKRALNQVQPLSKVLAGFSSVSSTFTSGLLKSELKTNNFFDSLESRIDKVSKKISTGITSNLGKTFNSSIGDIPVVKEVLGPDAVRPIGGILDQTLSDVVLNRFIGNRIPQALNQAISSVFGQQLTTRIANLFKTGASNSAVSNFLPTFIKDLAGGSLTTALENRLSKTLNSSFKLAFLKLNALVSEESEDLGRVLGGSIVPSLTPGLEDGFKQIDKLLGGSISSFIQNSLPNISEQAAKNSGIAERVREFIGLLTSNISGSIVTASVGYAAGGVQLEGLGEIIAGEEISEKIKHLTGGALDKLGRKLADITLASQAAEVGIKNVFQVVGSYSIETLVERISSGLLTNPFEEIIDKIPDKVKSVFSVLQKLFPEQIEGLKRSAITDFQSVFDQIIRPISTSPIEKVQAAIQEVNDLAANKKSVDLRTKADALSSKALDLTEDVKTRAPELVRLGQTKETSDNQLTRIDPINQARSALPLIQKEINNRERAAAIEEAKLNQQLRLTENLPENEPARLDNQNKINDLKQTVDSQFQRLAKLKEIQKNIKDSVKKAEELDKQVVNPGDAASEAQKESVRKVARTSIEQLIGLDAADLRKASALLQEAESLRQRASQNDIDPRAQNKARGDADVLQGQFEGHIDNLKEVTDNSTAGILTALKNPNLSAAMRAELVSLYTSSIEAAQNETRSPLEKLSNSFRESFSRGLKDLTLDTDFAGVFNKLDQFFEGTLSSGLISVGKNSSQSFAKGFIGQIASDLAPVANEIDATIRGAFHQAEEIPKRFTNITSTLGGLFASVSGVKEPLGVINALTEGVHNSIGTVAALSQQFYYLSFQIQVLRQLVEGGPFDLMIGQNIRLQQQLLSTKTAIAATNKVLKDGVEIKDPLKAINALDAPINAAIAKIRRGVLDIANVTASDLIESFQVISEQIGNTGLKIDQAANLTLSFASALGTLGIPLNEARVSLTEILTGTSTIENKLSRTLNLTNDQIRLFQSQGRLYEELSKRLETFKEGNKLAAQSFGGITSNIRQIVQDVGLFAGEKLFNTSLVKLNEFYNSLKEKREGLIKYFEAISNTLVKIFNDATIAITTLFQAIAPIAAEIPVFLFNFLAKTIHELAGAIQFTVKVLQPFLDIFTELGKVVLNYGGHFLRLAIYFNVLNAVINLLIHSFDLIAHALPGVGDLMFFLAGRNNGLINTFVNLAGPLGRGAAGFLLLGQNMNAIPGIAGIITHVLADLGLGPLAGLLQGFIPTLAGIGIQIAGVAIAFPRFGAAIESIFAISPKLVANLGKMAESSLLFKGVGLDRYLRETADGMLVFTEGTTLAGFATTKFDEAMVLAGARLQKFLISTTFIGVALYGTFLLIDKFIIQNKELFNTLGGLFDGVRTAISNLGEFIGVVLTNKFVLMIATALLIAPVLKGVKDAIANLIRLQMAEWALGIASGLERLSTVLKLIGFTEMSLGALQAGNGLKILSSILRGETKAELGLFFTSLRNGQAFTAFKSAIATNLLVSLDRLKSRLKVVNFTSLGEKATLAATDLEAAGSRFAPVLNNFGGLLKKINFAPLAEGAALTKAEVQLTTVAVRGMSIELGALANVIGATIGGLISFLAPIALITAGFIAVGAITEKIKLGFATDELETYRQATERLANNEIHLGEELDRTQKKQADRTEKGIALSKEEYAQNAKLQKQSKIQSEGLQAQIELLEKQREHAENEDVAKGYQIQIDELKKLKEALDGVSGKVEVKPRELLKLGTIFEDLTNKAEAAKQAILNPSGDPEKLKQQAQALIDVTNLQHKYGVIGGEEARSRLELVAVNTAAGYELETKAQEAITESYKTESDRRVATIQAQQEQIKGLIASGRLTQLEGDKELGKKKIEQLKEEYEAYKAQQAALAALREKGLKAALKDIDDKIALSEKQIKDAQNAPSIAASKQKESLNSLKAQKENAEAQIKTAQQTINKLQLVAESGTVNLLAGEPSGGFIDQDALDQAKTDLGVAEEHLKNIRRSISETKSTPLPVVADSAEIKNQEKNIKGLKEQRQLAQRQADAASNLSREEQGNKQLENQGKISEEELEDAKTANNNRNKELEIAREKAVDIATAAETELNTQTQELQNKGVIAKEVADERRVNSTLNKNKVELKAEQDYLAGLEKLSKLPNVADEEERQAKVRASREKTKQLTLQLLQDEEKAYETHIAVIKEELEKQTKIQENQIELQNQALTRQKDLYDVLGKALEQYNKLLEARKEFSDASSDYLSGELDLLAEGERSEFRKKELAEASAAIRLQAARKQAEFEKASLESQQTQNQLALKREIIENRIAQNKARDEVNKAKKDVEVALSNKVLLAQHPEEVQGIIESYQSKLDLLKNTKDLGGVLQDQYRQLPITQALQRSAQDKKSQLTIDREETKLALAEPPGISQQNLRRLNQQRSKRIGEELGLGSNLSEQGLINSGLANARNEAQNTFKGTVYPNIYSAYDPNYTGYVASLNSGQLGVVDQALKEEIALKFGPGGFPRPLTVSVPAGTRPLSLPDTQIPGFNLEQYNKLLTRQGQQSNTVENSLQQSTTTSSVLQAAANLGIFPSPDTVASPNQPQAQVPLSQTIVVPPQQTESPFGERVPPQNQTLTPEIVLPKDQAQVNTTSQKESEIAIQSVLKVEVVNRDPIQVKEIILESINKETSGVKSIDSVQTDSRLTSTQVLQSAAALDQSRIYSDTAIARVDTEVGTTSPAPVGVEILNPDPIKVSATTPAPVGVETIKPSDIQVGVKSPAPVGVEVLNPDPIRVSATALAAVGVETIKPGDIRVGATSPAPVGVETVKPGEIKVGATSPAPVGVEILNLDPIRVSAITPAAVGVETVKPSDIQVGATPPAPVGVETVKPGEIKVGASLPAPVGVEVLNPDPIRVSAITPVPVGVETVEPSEIKVGATSPTPVGVETIKPNEIQVGVKTPAPVGVETVKPGDIQVGTTSPAPVGVEILNPDPIRVSAITPAPVGVETIKPNDIQVRATSPVPVGVETIKPGEIQVGATSPTPVGVEILNPDPIRVSATAPAPVGVETINPGEIKVGASLPAPVGVEVLNPDPIRVSATAPAPVGVETVKPGEIKVGATSPAPVGVEILNLDPIRVSAITPAAVGVETVKPSDIQVGATPPAPVGVETVKPGEIKVGASLPAPVGVEVLNPDPIRVSAITPVPVGVETVEPSEIKVGATSPTPVGVETIKPNEIQVGVKTPAPVGVETVKPGDIQVGTTSPAPVGVEILNPDPIRVSAITPAPVGVETIKPNDIQVRATSPVPVGVETIKPGEIQVGATSPTPVGVEILNPDPIRVSATAPAPVGVETINPGEIKVGASLPAPVGVEVLNPDPIRVSATAPAPVGVETVKPGEIKVGASLPAPVGVEVLNPDPIRVSATAPAPVGVETVKPSEIKVGATSPTPVGVETIKPNEIQVGVKTPAPVDVETVKPEPIKVSTIAPAPLEVKTVKPNDIRVGATSPNPVEVKTTQKTPTSQNLTPVLDPRDVVIVPTPPTSTILESSKQAKEAKVLDPRDAGVVPPTQITKTGVLRTRTEPGIKVLDPAGLVPKIIQGIRVFDPIGLISKIQSGLRISDPSGLVPVLVREIKISASTGLKNKIDYVKSPEKKQVLDPRDAGVIPPTSTKKTVVITKISDPRDAGVVPPSSLKSAQSTPSIKVLDPRDASIVPPKLGSVVQPESQKASSTDIKTLNSATQTIPVKNSITEPLKVEVVNKIPIRITGEIPAIQTVRTFSAPLQNKIESLANSSIVRQAQPVITNVRPANPPQATPVTTVQPKAPQSIEEKVKGLEAELKELNALQQGYKEARIELDLKNKTPEQKFDLLSRSIELLKQQKQVAAPTSSQPQAQVSVTTAQPNINIGNQLKQEPHVAAKRSASAEQIANPKPPRKNSDILTAPLNQSTVERRGINVDEGAVKMSGFVVTQSVEDQVISLEAELKELNALRQGYKEAQISLDLKNKTPDQKVGLLQRAIELLSQQKQVAAPNQQVQRQAQATVTTVAQQANPIVKQPNQEAHVGAITNTEPQSIEDQVKSLEAELKRVNALALRRDYKEAQISPPDLRNKTPEQKIDLLAQTIERVTERLRQQKQVDTTTTAQLQPAPESQAQSNSTTPSLPGKQQKDNVIIGSKPLSTESQVKALEAELQGLNALKQGYKEAQISLDLKNKTPEQKLDLLQRAIDLLRQQKQVTQDTASARVDPASVPPPQKAASIQQNAAALPAPVLSIDPNQKNQEFRSKLLNRPGIDNTFASAGITQVQGLQLPSSDLKQFSFGFESSGRLFADSVNKLIKAFSGSGVASGDGKGVSVTLNAPITVSGSGGDRNIAQSTGDSILAQLNRVADQATAIVGSKFA